MKFTIRDLFLVTVIAAVSATAGTLVGFLAGDARQIERLRTEESARFMDQFRIKSLEQELERAGIPIPDKD
jgi:hypothetical protein